MRRRSGPRHTFLPNDVRAKIAIVGCGVHAGATAVHAVFFMLLSANYGLLEDTTNWETADQVLRIAVPASYVACGVSFVIWFRRAWGNAHAVGLRGGHALGWAVGAWFVPFLNLVRPAQIASEMWRHAGPERVGSPSLIAPWWTAFLLGNILETAANGMLDSDANWHSGVWLSIVADVSGVIGLALAIVIVRRLTKAQEGMRIVEQAATFE